MGKSRKRADQIKRVIMQEWVIPALFLIGAILLYPLAKAGLSFAPWVPTRKKDLARIVQMMQLTADDVVYEIGSGNGRVSLKLHDASEARVTGIEIAWPLHLISMCRAFLRKSDRINFQCSNAFNKDWSSATKIFTFGMPDKLGATFKSHAQKTCRKGTKIVSYVFPIEGWAHDVCDQPTKDDTHIYVYTIT